MVTEYVKTLKILSDDIVREDLYVCMYVCKIYYIVYD